MAFFSRLRLAWLTLVLSLLLTAGAAAANLIVNGSFEMGTLPGFDVRLPPGSTAIDGWTVVNGTILYVGGRWVASDGVRSVGLNGCATGGISQAFATEVGRDYEVRFDMAGDPIPAPGSGALKTLSLSAGGQPMVFTFDTTGHSPGVMGWQERVWVFTAAATTTTLTFVSLTSGCAGPALDNVRVMPLPSDLPPSLELTLTGCTTCAAGNQFSVEAHLKNPGTTSVPVELKVGFRLPDGTPVNLFGQHFVITLPASLDSTFPLLDFP